MLHARALQMSRGEIYNGKWTYPPGTRKKSLTRTPCRWPQRLLLLKILIVSLTYLQIKISGHPLSCAHARRESVPKKRHFFTFWPFLTLRNKKSFTALCALQLTSKTFVLKTCPSVSDISAYQNFQTPFPMCQRQTPNCGDHKDTIFMQFSANFRVFLRTMKSFTKSCAFPMTSKTFVFKNSNSVSDTVAY